MKMIMVLLLLLSFALASCAVQENTVIDGNMPDSSDDPMAENNGNVNPIDSEDHLGCQENEIGIDGVCVVAQDSNSDLFNQELGDSVMTYNITEGFDGYVAKPAEEGDYPGIIMIHEWWGLNENIEEMARILADQGYIVVAVDLYDGEIAENSSRAGELASQVRNNPDEAIGKMKFAVGYLKEEEGVTQIGSLGWCFGGGQSLQLSLNEDIDATVIYYGSLTDDPAELADLQGPVLGIFGSEDTSIPVEDVRSFEDELNDLGIRNEIYVYEGVGHAFANPSGSNYAKTQTIDAWNKTVDFLDSNLKEDQGMMDQESGSEDMANLSGNEVRLEISAVNYVFKMDGNDNPEIVVNVGDRVIIDLTSSQGVHNMYIDEFGVMSDTIQSGETTTIDFIASEEGLFEYYCAVGEHRSLGMEGYIRVEA